MKSHRFTVILKQHWQLIALRFHKPYLQRVVISGEGHHQLPEWWEHHQSCELQLVVGGHVLEQHGQAVHCQVLPLVLFRALHWHRPRHGERHVHHHHCRHDELFFSATTAENSNSLRKGQKDHKQLLEHSCNGTPCPDPIRITPYPSSSLKKGTLQLFYPQNAGLEQIKSEYERESRRPGGCEGLQAVCGLS